MKEGPGMIIVICFADMRTPGAGPPGKGPGTILISK